MKLYIYLQLIQSNHLNFLLAIDAMDAQAAEAVAAMENEKRILFHKASEEMKVKTARAVAIVKAEADRANEDIHLRRLQAESEQRRKRNIAAINAVFTHLSTSLSNAAAKPKEVLTFLGYICLLVSSIFFARETSKLIRSIIESFIGRPQLVRETTRKSLPWSFLAYAKLLVLPWNSKRDTKSIEDTFSDLILPHELKTRVVELAHSARNANKHQAPYRHVLLHGPPGTGKTLVAKKLAQVIGSKSLIVLLMLSLHSNTHNTLRSSRLCVNEWRRREPPRRRCGHADPFAICMGQAFTKRSFALHR